MTQEEIDAKIIIEIGANNGGDTGKLLNQFPNAIIYAFEPTHELLVNHLWPQFNNHERVRVIPFAVDVENGFKMFNIAGQADWGCSSLYEFTDNIHELWPDRPDFKTTHKYLVPTITMYDFCNLYNINSIDYLHIDTQGNDLNCLKSLKDKISIVKQGRCEVANKVELYKNTGNTYKNVHKFLTENGFKVLTAYEHDVATYEWDLFFHR